MARKYVTVSSCSSTPVNDPHALVTIVLPIFNAGKYLDQTLKSVRGQAYENLEIICINDGSTDDSLSLMREHALEDSRIVVIDKENEGYGASCNRGIESAHGEWIAIVEPDDWIDRNMIGDMLMFASGFSKKIDMIKTPYWRVALPDTPGQIIMNCPFNRRVLQSVKPFTIKENPELLRHHPCIWSALYRKSFLDENNIRFLPIAGAGWADNPFFIETYCQAKNIVYLDQAYYYYREETGEKNKNFHEKQWRIAFDRWNDMQKVLERLQVTDPGILLAHIKRGFTYSGGVLEFHKIEEEPDVKEALIHMFNQMDPALVWAEPDTPPSQKRLFAELRGLEFPDISTLAYVAHALGLGVYAATNIGIKQTVLAGMHFVSALNDRAAGR